MSKPETEDPILADVVALRLDKIKPDMAALDAVLDIQSNEVSSLTKEELSAHIHTLSVYTGFLQAQLNMREIKFNRRKAAFDIEHEIALHRVEGKTIKEKANKALVDNPKLQTLKKAKDEAEEKFILLKKIPESIENIMNALKKEYSSRFERY